MGYVNISISRDFTLEIEDALLKDILDKNPVLKAKFESEGIDRGSGLVTFEYGVSDFIIGLFKQIGIKNTRVTNLGYAFKGLAQRSNPDILNNDDFLVRQGVVMSKAGTLASNDRIDLNTMYSNDDDRMRHVFVFLAREIDLEDEGFLNKLREDCNLVSNGNRIIVIAENEKVEEKLKKEGFVDNINLDIVIFGKDLQFKHYSNINQLNAKTEAIDILSNRLDMIYKVDVLLAREILHQI